MTPEPLVSAEKTDQVESNEETEGGYCRMTQKAES